LNSCGAHAPKSATQVDSKEVDRVFASMANRKQPNKSI
jgi:hypothetical protein